MTEAMQTPSEGEELAVWFAAEYEPLLRLGYLLAGSSEGAEDLVQDTFARLRRAHRRVRHHGLHGYARHVIASLAQSDARRKILKARLKQLDEIPPRSGSGETIWRATLHLSPVQRIAFVLRFYEHRTDDEIAGILTMGAAPVVRLVQRALKHVADETDLSIGAVERQAEAALQQAAGEARPRPDALVAVYGRIRQRREHRLRIAIGFVVAIFVLAGAVVALPRLARSGAHASQIVAEPSPSPSPKPSPSPSASPSPSPSPSPSIAACGAASLSLTVVTDAQTYDDGQRVAITRIVRNTGSAPCSTGGSGCVPEVAVEDYNGNKVWSSRAPGAGLCERSAARILAHGELWETSYAWDQTECVSGGSDPCGGYPHATPGNYTASTSWPAADKLIEATSEAFFLTCCDASQSPSPSPGFTLIP